MGAPTRLAVLGAMRNAATAARRNLPPTVCPYDPHSADSAVRVLALTWVREYERTTGTKTSTAKPTS